MECPVADSHAEGSGDSDETAGFTPGETSREAGQTVHSRALEVGAKIKQSQNAVESIATAVEVHSGGGTKRGVGGWLLLLVLGFTFFGPLNSVAVSYTNISASEENYPALLSNESWRSFRALGWISIAVFCVYSIVVGFRLAILRTPEVVGQAKLALWMIGPFAVLVLNFFWPAVALDSAVQYPIHGPGFAIGQLIGGSFMALIWTLYLSKSKRVKDTYSLEA